LILQAPGSNSLIVMNAGQGVYEGKGIWLKSRLSSEFPLTAFSSSLSVLVDQGPGGASSTELNCQRLCGGWDGTKTSASPCPTELPPWVPAESYFANEIRQACNFS
jgi:hypothetical protein